MKRIGILGGILLVLVVLLLVQQRRQAAVVASAPARTIQLEADRVSKLRMEPPGQEAVELTRTSGGWRLTDPIDFEAQEPLVQNTLRQLEDLELEDIVSTNPEKRATYQVDSTGTRVQVWEGSQKVADLVIGKSSPDYGHTYVRPWDENAVYRAVGVLSYNFKRRVDDWRDRTIWDQNRADITRVEVEYPKEKLTFSLVRADSAWALETKGSRAEPDSAAVERLLANVSKVVASAFPDSATAAATDFSKPDFRVRVETDSGTEVLTAVYDGENKLLVRRESRPEVVYELYKASLSNVMKKPDELTAKSS